MIGERVNGLPLVSNSASCQHDPRPLTRTVRDSAILLQVMAGFDRRDLASIRQTPPDFMAATGRGIDGLRIGWSADFGFAPVFPEVVDVTRRAAMVFEELGWVGRGGEAWSSPSHTTRSDRSSRPAPITTWPSTSTNTETA